jgi:hypothetical protein
MAWIGALIAAGGAYMSSQSSDKAAKGAKYQPWTTTMPGVGQANFKNGQLSIYGDANTYMQNQALLGMQNQALGQYQVDQFNSLGKNFLHGAYDDSNSADALGGFQTNTPNPFFGNQSTFANQTYGAQNLGSNALNTSMGGYGGNNFLNAGQSMLGGYRPQNFNNLQGNMIANFNPNQAGSDYTNMLRASAQPQEQQAVASQMDSLFGNGRLGTTGGATMMGQLSQAQQQADIQRQIAGQQYGLSSQLQAQQGYDSALNAEQGRQIGGYNTNQSALYNQLGMASQLAQTGAGLYGSAYNNAGLGLSVGQNADQFGFNRMMGLNDTNYQRGLDMNNINYSRTQDRFNRSLQLFGADNAVGQQDLNNFSNLLGMQQSNNQQLMDLSRIGASVGQSQTAANANAAQIRNQGNQDAIAGALQAYQNYQKNKSPPKQVT